MVVLSAIVKEVLVDEERALLPEMLEISIGSDEVSGTRNDASNGHVVRRVNEVLADNEGNTPVRTER